MEPQASLEQILQDIDDPGQNLLYNAASVLQSIDSPPTLDNQPGAAMNGYALNTNGYNNGNVAGAAPQQISPNYSNASSHSPSGLPTFSQTFPSAQCAAASGGDTSNDGGGGNVQLYIVEEPVERCRFRYRAEQGPHGSLKSAASKKSRSCPKVQMVGYSGAGAYVVAKLYTNEAQPRLHVNDLWGSHCHNGISTMPLDDKQIAALFIVISGELGKYQSDKVSIWGNSQRDESKIAMGKTSLTFLFANLGIMRQKEKEICDVLLEKYLSEHAAMGYPITDELRESLKERSTKEQVTLKDCLHSVRIGFQGFYPDPHNGTLYCTPMIMSQPIFNSQNAGFTELRVAEVSQSSGSCGGGDSIWMRCAAKVRRDQIKIRFHEPSTGWEADGVFAPTEVYEQILVIFKTPPYRDVNIRDRVHVNMHLYRSSDAEYSPPIDFVYLPIQDGPQTKKRKLVTNFDGYDHFMGGPGPSAPAHQHQQQPPPPPPRNHHEMNAYMPAGNTTNNQRADAAANNNDGGASDFMPAAAQRPRLDVPLGELKLNDDSQTKMQHVLGQLWETQLQALRTFSSDGDPKALVRACKQLIGWQDEDGDSALHLAVRHKQPFALKTLLTVLDDYPDKAAIVNSKNARKQTALHLAVRYNDADCAHYLIASGAERTHLDSSGNTVVHYLADTFTEDIYKDILFPPEDTVAGKQQVDLALRNNAGQCPLHLAVKRLRLSLIENLLEAGTPVDVCERNTGHTPLMIAVQANDAEAANLLLQHNACATSTAMDGSTPLHWAVRNKHEAIVRRLVEAGADPAAKTAFWTITDDDDGMEYETLAGESSEKLSPLDVAGDNERLVKLLNGENIEPLLTPPDFRRPSYKPEENGMVSRPSKVRFEASGGEEAGGLPSDILAQGRPSGSAIGPSSSSSSSACASPSVQRHSSTVAALKDDLGSLDFVTRLRLSKQLDVSRKWERLADALSCQHMIEFINVCTEADDTSSPTILLLDQYEQMPGACVPSLLNGLGSIGEHAAVEVITRGRTPRDIDMDDEDGLLTEAAGGVL